MKKFFILLGLMLVMSTHVFATVTVELNGEPINFTDANGQTVNAQIINNRTMVPLRKIFELLGAEIEWNGSTQTVVATKGDTIIKLQINNPTAEISRAGVMQKIALDSKPIILNDRTLIPLRFVSESLGKQVAWNQDTQTAIIVDYEYFMNTISKKAPIFYEALSKKNNSTTPTTLNITKEYFDLKNSAFNTASSINAIIYNNSKNNKKVSISITGNSALLNDIKNESWSNFDINLKFDENGVYHTSTSSILNKMIPSKYNTYDELKLVGKFNDAWENFIKNMFGIEEKSVELNTFYRLNDEFNKFLNLFSFSNTSNSSKINATGINYTNATFKYLDYTKFDNVLLENDVLQVYNVLNKLIFNYDVTMEELLYDASKINVSVDTLKQSEVFYTTIVIALLNDYNEKVVYTVKIIK